MRLFSLALFLTVYIKYSKSQCSCDDGLKFVRGENIPKSLCNAKTLLEIYVVGVGDGPDNLIEYKVKVDNTIRGDLSGVAHQDRIYNPIPDPDHVCHSDIVLEVGQRYVVSVDKEQQFLVINLCNYVNDIKEITKVERDVMKYGCS